MWWQGSLPQSAARTAPSQREPGSLGPLCEGAPPAGGGGENFAIVAILHLVTAHYCQRLGQQLPLGLDHDALLQRLGGVAGFHGHGLLQ